MCLKNHITAKGESYFILFSNANQTQPKVNDANNQAESIIRRWEREGIKRGIELIQKQKERGVLLQHGS